jgi:hypothetical protein
MLVTLTRARSVGSEVDWAGSEPEAVKANSPEEGEDMGDAKTGLASWHVLKGFGPTQASAFTFPALRTISTVCLPEGAAD